MLSTTCSFISLKITLVLSQIGSFMKYLHGIWSDNAVQKMHTSVLSKVYDFSRFLVWVGTYSMHKDTAVFCTSLYSFCILSKCKCFESSGC